MGAINGRTEMEVWTPCQQQKLSRKLREYGIKILDHLIITDNKYLSMSDTMMVEFNIND